jgi:hypothetical protein
VLGSVIAVLAAVAIKELPLRAGEARAPEPRARLTSAPAAD